MLRRWLTVGSIVVVVGFLAWSLLPPPAGRVVEGSPAPDYTLPDLAGVQHSLPKGKVVLLNFWATWCPPCRDEMPSMIELHKQRHDKGLEIVAASVDTDFSKLDAFVREYSIPFQVLKDPERSVSLKLYGVSHYPESFLIDRSGTVRFHLIGAVDWTDKTVLKAINNLLAEKTPG